MKGFLITFEGSEGSGKSTQISLITKYLKKHGKSPLLIREPGGTDIGESIRQILLDVKNKKMSSECETLLYMAARAQLVSEVIIPALKKGKVVLCDRFLDSTLAYQGYGNGIDLKFIKQLGIFSAQKISPNLTIVFDIDAKEGLSRIKRSKDRIERRTVSYHNKVRNGFLELAKKDPNRIKVIRVNKGIDEIHQEVKSYVDRAVSLVGQVL